MMETIARYAMEKGRSLKDLLTTMTGLNMI
jgi:hypothetical protein